MKFTLVVLILISSGFSQYLFLKTIRKLTHNESIEPYVPPKPNPYEENDCGSVDGIELPCWDDYLGSGEGEESLPYYPFAKRANGCSTPFGPPGEYDNWGKSDYNFTFTSACNQHDRCYYTLGSDPLECNRELLKDLRRICTEGGWQSLTLSDITSLGSARKNAILSCYLQAQVITLAVTGTQSIYHSNAQDDQEEYENRVEAETGVQFVGLFNNIVPTILTPLLLN